MTHRSPVAAVLFHELIRKPPSSEKIFYIMPLSGKTSRLCTEIFELSLIHSLSFPDPFPVAAFIPPLTERAFSRLFCKRVAELIDFFVYFPDFVLICAISFLFLPILWFVRWYAKTQKNKKKVFAIFKTHNKAHCSTHQKAQNFGPDVTRLRRIQDSDFQNVPYEEH